MEQMFLRSARKSLFESQIEIEPLVHEIAEELFQSEPSNSQPGIYYGNFGIALFLGYHYKYYHQAKFKSKVRDIINLEIARASDYTFTGLNGLAGAGWTIQHLINMSVLDKNDEEILIDVDELILESIDEDLTNNNYDLMYGLIGKGTYYLERCAVTKNDRYLLPILIYINKLAKTNDKGTYWLYGNGSPQQIEQISLGLAHGIPSIIAFLCKLATVSDNPLIYQLIKDSTRWLLNHRNLKEDTLSCYGDLIPGETTSRLGWCYGDLGIAITLFKASKVLNDEKVYAEACRVAKKTTNRMFRDSKVSAILKDHNSIDFVDPGICHGLTGIVHLYNRLFQISGDPLFRDKMCYWLQLLLESRRSISEAPIGFVCRIFNGFDEQQYAKVAWTGSSNLIEGVSGIGLTLMNILFENMNWDQVFLTDINK